jgi:hypothetical protein
MFEKTGSPQAKFLTPRCAVNESEESFSVTPPNTNNSLNIRQNSKILLGMSMGTRIISSNGKNEAKNLIRLSL